VSILRVRDNIEGTWLYSGYVAILCVHSYIEGTWLY